jgi:hypothetical protein
MNRRAFLKLTGLIAAGQALQELRWSARAVPGLQPVGPELYADAASWLPAPSLVIEEPGMYRIQGLVRLQEPLVQISGIASDQSISWSDDDRSDFPVASFTSFEQYNSPGTVPEIRVLGGRLESLTALLVD